MHVTFLAPKLVANTFKNLEESLSQSFSFEYISDEKKINASIEESDVIIIESENPISLLKNIGEYDTSNAVVITFNSELQLNDHEDYVEDTTLLINAYCNQSISKQAGLISFLPNRELDEQQAELTETLFDQLGNILWLDDEIQFDGVKAVTESLFKTHLQTLTQYAKVTEKFGFTEEESYEILSLSDLSLNSLLVENDHSKPKFSDIENLLGLTENAPDIENIDRENVIEENIDTICNQNASKRTHIIEGGE